MMECLFLSPAPRGRRVCLYAVPDGVPVYFKHNELISDPAYRPLWRGNPLNIPEAEAARWTAPHTTPGRYRDYLAAPDAAGCATAYQSFQTAVAYLARQLEYADGASPSEVLIGETT